jgi:hypothetical protein
MCMCKVHGEEAPVAGLNVPTEEEVKIEAPIEENITEEVAITNVPAGEGLGRGVAPVEVATAVTA